MGVKRINYWGIPKPVIYNERFQNIVPILSEGILDTFKNWSDKLSRTDAEIVALIVINELKRLKIINRENYSPGLQPKNINEIERIIPIFNFNAQGNIVKVSQAEIYSIGGQNLEPSEDQGQIKPADLLPVLANFVGILDLRTAEIQNEIKVSVVHKAEITLLVNEEIQKQIVMALEDQTKKSINRIAKTADNIRENIKETIKSVEDSYAVEMVQLKKDVNQAKEDAAKIVGEVETQTKIAIDSVASGFKTEGALKAAFSLWEDKEKRHRIAFWIGICLFTAVIIAISTLGFWFNQSIFDYIGKIFVGTPDSITHVISRILLITAPLGVVIWVLRAILRWANLNLALAEDAAQRSVMAQTYVNLLTNGDVTEDKDDRKIMLEAIFRPLPGIQEMDTAPPSIINFSNPKASK